MSESVRHLVAKAISEGAPAYNAGDASGCVKVYHAVVQAIREITALDASVRSGLGEALDLCARSQDLNVNARTLRRALDLVLESPMTDEVMVSIDIDIPAAFVAFWAAHGVGPSMRAGNDAPQNVYNSCCVVERNTKQTNRKDLWLGGISDELLLGRSWRLLTNRAEWHARCDHTAVAAPGILHLFGGVDKGAWCYGDAWNSLDGGRSWKQAYSRCMPWCARSGHATVLDAEGKSRRILLLGGVGKDTILNDVWKSSDGGSTWSLVTKHAEWRPRYGHRAVVVGADVVVVGGVTTGGFLADVWKSTHGGRNWKSVALDTKRALWPARAAHAVVSVQNTLDEVLVMLAGMGEDGPLQDVWQSWDGGTEWKLATGCAPWVARSGTVAAVAGHECILICGGFTGDVYLADVWTSEDFGVTWTCVAPTAPWAPRYCHAVVTLSSSSLLMVGGHAGDHSLRDVWQSPDHKTLSHHMHIALLVGMRLQAMWGLSREVWCRRILPYLLPLRASAFDVN